MNKIKLKSISNKFNKNRKFNNIRPMFHKWLKQNIDKFNVKLIYIGNDRYKFEGIIKNIYLQMDFNQPEAMLACDDNDGDNYDADRVDNIFKYYQTLEELYTTEIFECILDYVNKYLIDSNCLVLSKYKIGTEAKIIHKNDYIKKENRIDYVYDLWL